MKGLNISGPFSSDAFFGNNFSRKITEISIAQKKPIGNSIITLFNRDQATQRFDRGKEAARAVLEVLKIK